MQYDLDPRLLPPGGVSVQCTRCRFVFVAGPSGILSPAPAPKPAPSAAGSGAKAPALNSTLIFGSRPDAPGNAAPATSSQRTEPSGGAAPAATSAQRPTAAPSPSVTQPFGSLPPEAFPPGLTPPFGTRSVDSSEKPREKTQLFGPGLSAAAQGSTEAPARAPAPPSKTQIFGAGELDAVARPVSLPPEDSSSAPGSKRAQSAVRRAPMSPPPDLFNGRLPGDAPPRTPKRKDGLLFVGGVLGVLILVAALAYPAWRRNAQAIPAELVAAQEEAAALLRRDDAASREQAITGLKALLTQRPDYTEAHAALALALALDLDDVRAELVRNQETEAQLVTQVVALNDAKFPADWEIRANALRDDVAALRKAREPLEARVQQLVQDSGEAQTPLNVVPKEESAAAASARIRAQAVYAGVLAATPALELAERLSKAEPTPHWVAVARAEYALNANSPPATLAEVATALEAVRELDRTFLRAYVLGARVALRQGDTATAQALLDAVMAFNPNHALARKLKEWTVAATASEAAPSP